MRVNHDLMVGCFVAGARVELLAVGAAVAGDAVLVVPTAGAPGERGLCSPWLVLLDGLGW